MRKLHITLFLSGLVLALTVASPGLAQSPQPRPTPQCESGSPGSRVAGSTDFELLARAEDRVESLRARLYEIEIKEMGLLASLDDLDYWLTPEGIQRALVFVGSARPMDEWREALRVRLETQKARVNKQIELLRASRERLESEIAEAETVVEALRQRLADNR